MGLEMSIGVCQWLFLLFSLSTWTLSSSKEARIVCYYTNWSVYRPGDAKFTPQNINPYLCTHLIYAFGGFTKENTLKPFDKYQDIEKGGYAKFTGLKTYNKKLKTMLAIGGWNEGSTRFSPMVANPERRKELVKNAVRFLRQNHFDGLDLDWEYPAFRDGGKSRDRNNYANLVQELREEFERESEKTGRPRLLLTMAVPAGIEYINKGYDVPKLTEYLDWMNILSYDYHSAFEPAVNHHAPLYSLEEDNEYNYDGELNIDYTIKHYLKLGADPTKLVLGIPTYGRSYTLFNPDAYEIGSPADGPGNMGEATRENGYLAYYEICDYVKNQEWEVEQPNPNAMGPYASKDNQWVGYDDENIVRKKAEYVAENGLGGIMFWAIDNDDFRGKCHGKPYPLIEAGKEALLNAYGLTDDNLISPPTKPVKSRTRTRTKTVKPNSVVEEDKTPSPLVSRRRNRIKQKEKEKEKEEDTKDVSKTSRRKFRRKSSDSEEGTSTYSSLTVNTPSYTTPAPPATPEMGGAFTCEDEGFFPHPKDCKKYFWCLSGAGDSGIVAHQFTCPAGLYFNKAADSCDYTQNVLCNKKLQKAKSTTSAVTTKDTTTSTTPVSVFVSTTRAPPKITAATSKTTVKLTSSTEAYKEEYEYEDEEEDEEKEEELSPNSRKNSGKDSEEDPQVIKELIDLIKKAGGLEELERQFKSRNYSAATPVNSSGSADTTTASSFDKSLYERVLSKALQNSVNNKKKTYTGIRNSRGPQSEGIKDSAEEKTERGKLHYTSITRNRPITTSTTTEATATAVEKQRQRKNFELEYVNIRRNRFGSTTESNEKDSTLDRNKILGEVDNESDDDDDVDDDEEDPVGSREKAKGTFTPQYVNIRRQRPSTEAASTSKYVEIRRGTTPADIIDETTEHEMSKYKTIRRGTTITPSTTEETTTEGFRLQSRRGTTVTSTATDNITESTKSSTPLVTESITSTQSSTRAETTEFTATTTPISSTVQSETTTTQQPAKNHRFVPNPRPNFRVGVRPKSTTVATPTTTVHVKLSTPSPFSRPTKIPLSRRKYQTLAVTAASGATLESQDKSKITTRYRFVPRKEKPTPRTPVGDQVSDSSNQQSLEKDNYKNHEEEDDDEEREHEEETSVSQSVQNTTSGLITKEAFLGGTFKTTPKAVLTTPQTYHTIRKVPTRSRLTVSHSTASILVATPPSTTLANVKRRPRPPLAAFNYERIATDPGNIPEHTKVLLHSNGIIECLDQGNFPHPVSCKKFISCAKMDLGKVLGWEYTCPKGLSFDPIGGMCNWSADLGCDE